MRTVLDTNVLVSGVFFRGPPYRILRAWRSGRLSLVLSAAILEEYERVCAELSAQFPAVDAGPFMRLLCIHGVFFDAPPLATSVCEDPDDDKFVACALAANAKVIVSGDHHLLAVNGYRGLDICGPRDFLTKYLGD